MSAPVARNMTSRIKPGMCPHGMPAGSCPICNGMGGGATQNKRADVRKAGEMTWSECFQMGLRMKADKLHKQQQIQDRIDAQRAMLAAQSKLADAVIRLERMADMIKANFPEPANKLANLITKLAIPTVQAVQKILNFVQNVGVNLTQFINDIKIRIEGIQDKLAAILGEFVNAKDKAISERLKTARKKIFAILFGEIDEEIKELEKIEEYDRGMEIKVVKETLLDLKKYEEEIEEEVEDELGAAV